MSRRVRDYFELVSPQWDVMRKSFYGEEVRDAVLNAARISPDDTVLDVGAGTGFHGSRRDDRPKSYRPRLLKGDE